MISIKTMKGVIERRILINYNIDADVMAQQLPAPFRPKLVNGRAIGGLCFIRLKGVQPSFSFLPWGVSSENVVHRLAVEWDDPSGQTHSGVYIPRRDTNSKLNEWAGGRVFPGHYHNAAFAVIESKNRYSISIYSEDRQTQIFVQGGVADQLSHESVFADVDEASAFFAAGSVGYSDDTTANGYEGLEMSCQDWSMTPLKIETIRSSYFDDTTRYPAGSVQFDSALLAKNVVHKLHTKERLPKTTALSASIYA